MKARTIKTGDRLGRLTTLQEDQRQAKHRRWICRCDCGTVLTVQQSNLTTGNTTSCGCYRREKTVERSKVHGAWQTAEYDAWINMKDRCSNPNNPSYSYYGGRGVLVCDEWLHSFEQFLSDVGPRPSQKHSIDRMNVNGNYEPGNVRWATKTEQSRNKRSNRHITVNGETRTVAEWAQLRHISTSTIYTRLYRNASPEDTVNPKRGIAMQPGN